MNDKTAFLRLAKAIVLGYDDDRDYSKDGEGSTGRLNRIMEKNRYSGFQVIRPFTFLIDNYKVNDDN